jgi:hypothetical protein
MTSLDGAPAHQCTHEGIDQSFGFFHGIECKCRTFKVRSSTFEFRSSRFLPALPDSRL